MSVETTRVPLVFEDANKIPTSEALGDEAGEMAPHLRALGVLPEDPDSFPSIYTE